MFLLLQTCKCYSPQNHIRYRVSRKRPVHITVRINARIPAASVYTVHSGIKWLSWTVVLHELTQQSITFSSRGCTSSLTISKKKDRECSKKSRGFSLVLENYYIPFLPTLHWPRLVTWLCLTARVLGCRLLKKEKKLRKWDIGIVCYIWDYLLKVFFNFLKLYLFVTLYIYIGYASFILTIYHLSIWPAPICTGFLDISFSCCFFFFPLEFFLSLKLTSNILLFLVCVHNLVEYVF